MGRLKIFESGGGKEMECRQDPNNRSLQCRTFKRGKDGTEENLAFIKVQMGSDCKPIITESGESREGELDMLEKKIMPKLSKDCEVTRPENY